MISRVPVLRGAVEVVVPVHSDYVGMARVGTPHHVSSPSCGHVKSDRVLLCFNHEDGVYCRRTFMSCGKPDCSVCFKWGWAVRSARRAGLRLEESAKIYGDIEHFAVSVPLDWYKLSFDDLVKRVLKALDERGIVGGCLIFHRDRFHGVNYSSPYWGFHFHVVGHSPERSKCRSCKLRCSEHRDCCGFVNRNYRCGEKDGCLVKVLGKRKSVVGTLWYQLHHSSYCVDSKRHNVVRWFGVCSYRKLKVVVPARKCEVQLCPRCHNELLVGRYHGFDGEIWAWLRACRNGVDRLPYEAFLKTSRGDWVIERQKSVSDFRGSGGSGGEEPVYPIFHD